MASSLRLRVSAPELLQCAVSPPTTPAPALLESPRGPSFYSGFIGWGGASRSPGSLLESEAPSTPSPADSATACGASHMSPDSQRSTFGDSVRTHNNIAFSPHGGGISTSSIDEQVFSPGTPDGVRKPCSGDAAEVLVSLAPGDPHSSRSRRVRLSVPGEQSPCCPGDLSDSEEDRPSSGVCRVGIRRVGAASTWRRRVSCPATLASTSSSSGEEPSTSSCGLSPKTPQRHLYRPSWPAPRSILRSSCQLQGTSSVAPTTAGSFGVCCPSAASTSGLASPSQARHLPGASTSPTFSYPAVNAPASEDDNVLLIPPALAAAAAALSPEDAALFDADMRDLEACGLVEWQSADDLHAAALVRLAGSTDWARLAAGLNASPVGWADEEAADRLLLSPQWREAMAHQQAHAATAAGGDAVSAMQAAVAKLRQEQDGAAEEQVEQEPQLAGTLSSAFSMSHEDRLLFGADMADLEAFGLVDWQVADLEQRVTSTRLQRLSEQMAQMLADMQAEGRQRQQQQQWQWQGREGMQQRGGSWCGVEACGAPGAPCGAEAPRLVAVV